MILSNPKLYMRGHDPRPDSDYDPKELALGIKIELEHADDEAVAKKIAKDHLDEDPRYYSKLVAMEKGFKKNPSQRYGFRATRPKTPDEHCKLSFLKYLRENNYISESGQEYVAEEVDDLYHQKLSRRFDSLETKARRESKNYWQWKQEQSEDSKENEPESIPPF